MRAFRPLIFTLLILTAGTAQATSSRGETKDGPLTQSLPVPTSPGPRVLMEERGPDDELKLSLTVYQRAEGEIIQWITVDDGERTTSEWLNRAPYRLSVEHKHQAVDIFHRPWKEAPKSPPSSPLDAESAKSFARHLKEGDFTRLLARDLSQRTIANQLYELGPGGKRKILERYNDSFQDPRHPVP